MRFRWVFVVLLCCSCSGMSVYETRERRRVEVRNHLAVEPVAEDSGVVTVITEQPTGKGSMLIHASYNDEAEVCAINHVVTGEVLGQTETEIGNLDPGRIKFVLGDLGKATLDGALPYCGTSNGDQTFGQGQVRVIADASAAELQVELIAAPQYECGRVPCEYSDDLNEIPATCTGDSVLDAPQWIWLQTDGTLQGSEDNSFGGQGNSDDIWTLRGSDLIYGGTNPWLGASSVVFNSDDLSFSYILSHSGFEFAFKINCELQD